VVAVVVVGFDLVVGCKMVRTCHTQARRLRRPRWTKFDHPRPPVLLQHLLRHLLLILLLDPLQIMRHDRRNTPRIILTVTITIP
jgi:hypothetical protein